MKIIIKQIVLAAALVAASASVASAAGADVHNFANYNIRYVNPNNGDTGEKSWSVRGPYVARVIKDYDFDIVGMQEVTGRNGGKSVNPSTGRSQLEDMKAWLANYSFLEWERSGNNNAKDYSYNALAYKKDRYECVESGCFWLSPSPDTPGPGWDTDPDFSGLWRTCGWAKMKVRSTGEIFYFAVTHVNYGPSLDGRNSGELISRRLGEIAGNYPVVLVGDFNMRRADHSEAYSAYASHFYDAALTAAENYCLPESNPSTNVTGQNWYPVNSSMMSGSEFDFCFYRNMDVRSRHIITEYFGRTVNPSDHFPVMIRCVLSGERIPATVHVDREAAAGGDGSVLHPFRTIAEGVAAAGMNGTVKITAGTYKENIRIPASMTLAGGYASDFSELAGRTLIDASDMTECPMYVENWYSLNLSGFGFENYVSSKMASDGALRFRGNHLRLTDVDFSSNKAFASGGAMSVDCRDAVVSACRFYNNTASENGGGAIFKLFGELIVDNSVFQANEAKSGSAAVVTDAAELIVRNSAFIVNSGRSTGALFFNGCPSASRYSIVNSTFASNRLSAPSGLPVVVRGFGGAAICANLDTDVPVNMAHLTVVGNEALFSGTNKDNFNAAAINVYGLGRLNLHNSIVAGNYSDSGCGDVKTGETAVVEKERFNIYSCRQSVNFTADGTDFLAADFSGAIGALEELLGGKVSDGRFIPDVRLWGAGKTSIVLPLSVSYAGQPVNVITSYQRLLENQFIQDLDGDGKIGGLLAVDQCGNARADASMPGAAEYIVYSGIKDYATASDPCQLTKVSTDVYRLSSVYAPVALYGVDGSLLDVIRPDAGGDYIVDLGGREAGIYLISSSTKTFKLVK